MKLNNTINKATVGIATLGIMTFGAVKSTKSSEDITIQTKNSVSGNINNGSNQSNSNLSQKQITELILKLKSNEQFNNSELIKNISDYELSIIIKKVGDEVLNDEFIKSSVKSENTLYDYLYIYLVPIIVSILYGYTYSGGIKNILIKHIPANSAFYRNFFFLNGLACIRNGLHFGSLTYAVGTLGALIGWRSNEWLKEKIANGDIVMGGKDNLFNYLSNASEEDQKEIIEHILNNINNNGGDIRLLIEKLNKEFFVLTEEEQREETIKKILKDWADSENTSIVIYKKPAPGHSYEEEKPIYWNKAMEDFSEYSFNEVKDKTQKEIMDLMYGYDNAEFNRVNGQLRNLDENGVGYNHVVFPAQTKTGKIKQSAWNTRAIKEGGRLSFGSPEQAEIQKTLQMDPVFDCYNSKALYQHFIALINKYGPLNTEKDKILSLAYCDIDDFKRFNTEFGHKIGDVVLSTFISFIKKELRGDEDSLYRKGGDEFVALCNFVDKDTIKKRVEYMREHFSRFTIIIEFVEGQMIVSKTKHGSNLSAEAYYNMFKSSNKEIQANILEHEMNMKKGIEDDKLKNIKGKIVLPPICSTWGIVDYNYGEMLSKTSKIQKEVIEMLLNLADTAMYEGKDTGKNTVKVIEIGEIEKY